jgi:hypothetical protein
MPVVRVHPPRAISGSEVKAAEVTGDESRVFVRELGGWVLYRDVSRWILFETYHRERREATWMGYGVVITRLLKSGHVRLLSRRHSNGWRAAGWDDQLRIGLTLKGREEAQVETAALLFRGEAIDGEVWIP